MTDEAMIEVEVAYALPDEQQVLTLQLPLGATVQQAVEQSGIRARFPDMNLAQLAVGVFGKVVPPTRALRHRDRVEIYRPLVTDPKQQRRQRARQIREG